MIVAGDEQNAGELSKKLQEAGYPDPQVVFYKDYNVAKVKEIAPETTYIDGDAFFNSFFDGEPPHHCNGFIASGNATSDGQLVFTHSTICGGGAWWWTYYISLRWNIMLDIQPSTGNRIMMPTSPGYIWSDEDYYQNDNGIVFLI